MVKNFEAGRSGEQELSAEERLGIERKLGRTIRQIEARQNAIAARLMKRQRRETKEKLRAEDAELQQRREAAEGQLNEVRQGNVSEDLRAQYRSTGLVETEKPVVETPASEAGGSGSDGGEAPAEVPETKAPEEVKGPVKAEKPAEEPEQPVTEEDPNISHLNEQAAGGTLDDFADGVDYGQIVEQNVTEMPEVGDGKPEEELRATLTEENLQKLSIPVMQYRALKDYLSSDDVRALEGLLQKETIDDAADATIDEILDRATAKLEQGKHMTLAEAMDGVEAQDKHEELQAFKPEALKIADWDKLRHYVSDEDMEKLRELDAIVGGVEFDGTTGDATGGSAKVAHVEIPSDPFDPAFAKVYAEVRKQMPDDIDPSEPEKPIDPVKLTRMSAEAAETSLKFDALNHILADAYRKMREAESATDEEKQNKVVAAMKSREFLAGVNSDPILDWNVPEEAENGKGIDRNLVLRYHRQILSAGAKKRAHELRLEYLKSVHVREDDEEYQDLLTQIREEDDEIQQLIGEQRQANGGVEVTDEMINEYSLMVPGVRQKWHKQQDTAREIRKPTIQFEQANAKIELKKTMREAGLTQMVGWRTVAKRAGAVAATLVAVGSLFGCSPTNVDETNKKFEQFRANKEAVAVALEQLEEGEVVLPNGLHQNLTEFNKIDEKETPYSYGPSKVEACYGNVEATKEMALQDLYDSPLALATFASHFPDVLEAAGLPTDSTPEQILNKLYGEENGGEMQAKMYEMLEQKIKENVDINYSIEEGKYGTAFGYKTDLKSASGELVKVNDVVVERLNYATNVFGEYDENGNKRVSHVTHWDFAEEDAITHEVKHTVFSTRNNCGGTQPWEKVPANTPETPQIPPETPEEPNQPGPEVTPPPTETPGPEVTPPPAETPGPEVTPPPTETPGPEVTPPPVTPEPTPNPNPNPNPNPTPEPTPDPGLQQKNPEREKEMADIGATSNGVVQDSIDSVQDDDLREQETSGMGNVDAPKGTEEAKEELDNTVPTTGDTEAKQNQDQTDANEGLRDENGQNAISTDQDKLNEYLQSILNQTGNREQQQQDLQEGINQLENETFTTPEDQAAQAELLNEANAALEAIQQEQRQEQNQSTPSGNTPAATGDNGAGAAEEDLGVGL